MEKIWFRLGREFAAAGHEVDFFSRAWPGFPENETIEGVRMHRVPGFNHTRRLWKNLLLDLIWGLRVARRLPPADVVVCNTVSLPAYLRWVRPSAGKVVAVLGRMPKGHARFYGGVDRLIATSEAVRERVIVENARLGARTRVFPNPMDWTLQGGAIRKAADGAPVAIGYVGRLHPEKGLEILLQAAALLAGRPGLPRWRLRFIGPREIAQGGGGPRFVEILGKLAGDAGAGVSIEPPLYDVGALARIYGELDIFCYPSLAEKGEGLSVAPIEAMAAGAAPVVSGLDCYRDVIRDGENGLTFDHRAPNAAALLADRLALLISDPVLRGRLAAQAVQDSRRFDYAVVAKDILGDFDELLKPGRSITVPSL
jgi:glycosyltransferase involved in cell wall biosynthesis